MDCQVIKSTVFGCELNLILDVVEVPRPRSERGGMTTEPAEQSWSRGVIIAKSPQPNSWNVGVPTI